MSNITRTTALESRHRALGSDLSQSWNGLPIPQNYATDAYDEVTATRTRAGLIEVTGLNMWNVSGPDATKFLNYLLTTDISKALPGDSHISNTVDESGALIDDVLVYVDGADTYRISHGGGAFGEAMEQFAPKYDVKIERDNDVHILSLQGPVALEVLAPHTPANLATLGYFKHLNTTLFGRSISIARGGYSAERGYEVFTRRADAGFIWDSILEAGKAKGVIPVSWTSLDIVRVEGGLLFFPFDMPHGDTTPWEVRADWTVDLDKPDFRGKAALVASKGNERSFITGLEVDHNEAINSGAKVFADGKEVGVVTSTVFSQHLMKSLGIGQIAPSHTGLGTALEIVDGDNTFKATVVRMPFYDPLRLRTHPPVRD
jgi:aminomethyltransferase